MVTTTRITLHKVSARRGFSIVFDELWTSYLPHISPHGALLYCYLLHLAHGEIPSPMVSEWESEVCLPLGLTLAESHIAWARLQEMCLLVPTAEGYALCDPTPRQDLRRDNERQVLSELERMFGRPLSMTEVTLAQEYEQIYGNELVLAASAVAVEAQARSLPYMRQVLLNWHAKGITTAAQATEDTNQFRHEKAKRAARRGGETKPGKAPKTHALPTQSTVNYDESEIVARRIKRAEAEEGLDGHED